MRGITWIVAFCAATAAACGGTDVGNPVVDVDFPLYNDSFEDEGGNGTLRAVGETTTLTEAWMAVERIRLRDAVNCNGNAEIELVGPFAIDLLDAGPVPQLTGIEMPAIGYCRFELRWAVLDTTPPAGAPLELEGASIVIKGARGDGTPFVLRSDRGDELRLDAVGGEFTIDDATVTLFVGFDGKRLFSTVDLDGAVVDGDGTIRIEPGSNDAQLSVFNDNVDTATELFDDDDADGQLDPEERDSTDILAD